ncbi:DUF427 domain-containing protein [Lapillicoccus jejuensis]|uniref:Uncharacterized protein (DUF427 family) n=1 Tax=Lapillicoccus jejuensis TaxID=402171 RepID=A0A542DVT4_9MICO|nr:DUF427 domain-containing protein [Lapillicoccus jejuensis]TQJ07183.1 uncharacterized protein (DUF427 family) [Lapillicoccus jejuensis]
MRPVPITPGPGQESVWAYPRPPRVEPVTVRLTVELAGVVVADTDRCSGEGPAEVAHRVLETSHPPTYYLPASAFAPGTLRPASGSSYCEWKGVASYADLVVTDVGGASVVARRAAWGYPDPTTGYDVLLGQWAVMPAAVDRCTVGGETVVPQEGGFYGGWVTSAVVGPFKGGPGSMGW